MGAKATFDPITRIITLIQAPTLVDGEWIVNVDVKVDLYSDGKEDWVANEALRRVRFPISAVGGQSRPGGKLGTSYFLRSDWKIVPYDFAGVPYRLQIEGNLYSVDGKSTVVLSATQPVALELNLSALVEVEFADACEPATIATAVWDHVDSGDTGRDVLDLLKGDVDGRRMEQALTLLVAVLSGQYAVTEPSPGVARVEFFKKDGTTRTNVGDVNSSGRSNVTIDEGNL